MAFGLNVPGPTGDRGVEAITAEEVMHAGASCIGRQETPARAAQLMRNRVERTAAR
jgi:hypothetical protein